MAGETHIPAGYEPVIPLIQVDAAQGFAVHFVPMQGVVDQFGNVTSFNTLRQPFRTDEPENTTPLTGQSLLATSRSGTLPTFGLTVFSQAYSADPVQANAFIRSTGGTVFGGGSGASTPVTNRNGADVRAFVYGFNATGSDARPIRVNDADELVVSNGSPTPDTITTAVDRTLDTAVAVSIAAAAPRRQIIVQNLEAAGGNNVRVGDANIATNRGIRIGPGESVTLEVTAELFGIEEAGAPQVSVTELSVA